MKKFWTKLKKNLKQLMNKTLIIHNIKLDFKRKLQNNKTKNYKKSFLFYVKKINRDVKAN